MEFDKIVKQVNGKGFFIHGLSQIEDMKKWSVMLRKKNDSRYGYGTGKTIKAAVVAAIANFSSQFTEKQWREFAKTQVSKGRKKRVRLGKRK